jgi:putative ABC transport system substrate-binding protein
MIVSKTVVRFLSGALLVGLCVPVYGQHPIKVARIGYLGHVSASVGASTIQAFRQGLRQLGYVEGKTLSSSGDIMR